MLNVEASKTHVFGKYICMVNMCRNPLSADDEWHRIQHRMRLSMAWSQSGNGRSLGAKKNGANKKKRGKPPSNGVSGERKARYGKEGEESEGGKRLAVGSKRGETGACRFGVGRGNQEGGAPRCSAHKDVHPARRPPGPILFSSFFWWLWGWVVQQEGPGRLTKSRRVADVHAQRCFGKPLQPFATRGCVFLASHPTTTRIRPAPTEGAGSRKKMVRSWRPRPLLEPISDGRAE